MDDRDLELIRSFRATEAEPPPGLRERIHEDLWQLILAEEAANAAARTRARGFLGRLWRSGLLRPAVAAGTAAVLAVGVAIASDGGTGSTVDTGRSVQQAGTGVLDAAATGLFGGDTNAALPRGVTPVGSIDLRTGGQEEAGLARGPAVTDDELDASSQDAAAQAPRDPSALRDSIRAAVAESHGPDPGDRQAFTLAMQWVVHPAVPTDLRSSMLRSVEGLAGLDAARMGTDVLGRPGLVVGHFDQLTGVREQWVLGGNGRLLEVRSYTTAYVDPACPPGTYTRHAVFDERGVQVEASDALYIDWPQVIAACDPSSGAAAPT